MSGCSSMIRFGLFGSRQNIPVGLDQADDKAERSRVSEFHIKGKITILLLCMP